MNKAVVALMVAALTLGLTATVSAQTEEDVDANAGDVNSQDLTEERETVNWAMIYGSVEETVSLTDDDEDVFSWDEAESAADGSAVLAVENGQELDTDNLEGVDDNNFEEVDGVPEDGADSFENTFDFETQDNPEALEEDTAVTSSETFTDGDNLFVYTEQDADDPVWAGLVETEEAHEDEDYEVLVGQDENQFESSYDLYVELEEN